MTGKAKSNTLFTVLIACFNGGDFLKTCIDSIVEQDCEEDLPMVLFVNDASTDDSLKIAEAYKTTIRNLSIVSNASNIGLVRSCNKAIGGIKTPYFLRLDADDYLAPDAFRKIAEEIDRMNGDDFVVFNRWDVMPGGKREIHLSDNIYEWIAVGTLFKTEAVKAVKGYSSEHWEEYDLYIKFLENGQRYRVSPYRIYYYRRGHVSMTKNAEDNRKGFNSLIKKWGLSTLKKYGDFGKMMEYYLS